MKKLLISLLSVSYLMPAANAQDTVKQQNYSFHFQQTIITQFKPSFSAPYTGRNSLITKTETQTSITSTFFGAARLWKGAEVYFNPELSGGAGLSGTTGAAGFPNGETFRVGDPKPQIYIGRLYFSQNFMWGKDRDTVGDGQNQLAGIRSKRYFSFSIGKFGLADFFDDNEFSHDPRSQFMNWSLMDNGAYDYAANTRGYVLGSFFEFGQPTWTLRFAFTMATTEANGAVWDQKIGKANSQNIEFEKRYLIDGFPGTVRVLAFLNNGKMGNYAQALIQNPNAPDIDATQAYGRHKYGFGISADQYLNDNFGVFAKTSYNDGHTETWFFTEIDRSFSAGATWKGATWKRPDDEFAIAFVANGLSQQHRNYLAAGGYGFIIGDGKLNYSPELLAEIYYKANIYHKNFFLSPDYQFILHPAYNADRGPVHVLGIRAHAEF